MKSFLKVLLIAIVIFIGLYFILGSSGNLITYSLTTTYPAACWTDDGKQIVYLMHKQIDTVAPPKIWTSKTYLMIMDADGKNKKVIGEVPEYGQKKTYEKGLYNLSKEEAIRLGNRVGNVSLDLELRYKKDLPEKWKKLQYTRYLDISPDFQNLLILDSKIHGLVKIDLNGKRKVLEKSTYQKKCYLFLPPWWRV